MVQAEAETEDLSTRLAAALAAREAGEADLDAVRAELEAALAAGETTQAELQSRLAAAVLDRDAARAEAEAARAAGEEAERGRADLADRLAAAISAREAAETRAETLSQDRSETEQERAEIESRLAQALADLVAARDEAERQGSEAERRAALLATARAALSDEEGASAEAQRRMAALNAQVAALREDLAELRSLLGRAETTEAVAEAEIENLGRQLTTALARAAAEERRRRELEEDERLRLQEEAERLAAEAENLERYRSNFFGELRGMLEGQEGVRIAGDRFVFSSEVLFGQGEATLSEVGKAEIAKVAALLRRIAAEIPPGIDWVIRVDGHTDDIPIRGGGRYRDNWELSQARALSVVRYMSEEEGIPPGRLAANGFGEYQPLDPGDTAQARARNRRIELKLTER
ncbi:flagellar motor rotation protein MotB [Limimaricola cinnabarinus LL-001]|uniref:Flagellar motor rotation protein MotB n=1 Tax=Limimaricola cinnabarinus LL-001 TaxID=1337093 RepID=U2YK75_9RHOB|nr:flagellar motor rotation protein MotB [Limimaricola cinnabarinus LL-001]